MTHEEHYARAMLLGAHEYCEWLGVYVVKHGRPGEETWIDALTLQEVASGSKMQLLHEKINAPR